MLPVATSISTYTLQPPIVNTTTPGTTVTHVPYDNVAPSVSSAQVDNNTKGNSGPAPPPSEQPAAALPDLGDGGAGFTAPSNRAQALASIAAQPAFIAQLAAQDSTPETQGILIQYEKLIMLGDVKYMPSNAAKPQAAPSSVFGQILQAEQAAPQHTASVAAVQAAAPPPTAAEVVAATNNSAIVEVRTVARSNKSNVNAVEESAPDNAPTESPVTTQNIQVVPAPQIINAYIATASRVALQSPHPDIEPVTEVA